MSKKATAKKTPAKKTPAKKAVIKKINTETALKAPKKENSLSEREIKNLERQLNICEAQIIRHFGNPEAQAMYEKNMIEILEKLNRTKDAPYKRY